MTNSRQKTNLIWSVYRIDTNDIGMTCLAHHSTQASALMYATNYARHNKVQVSVFKREYDIFYGDIEVLTYD